MPTIPKNARRNHAVVENTAVREDPDENERQTFGVRQTDKLWSADHLLLILVV